MEDLQQLWNQYNTKLNTSLKLNISLLRKVNSDKAKSSLTRLLTGKAFEGILFLAIIYMLTNFIIAHLPVLHLSISALILDIFAIAGLSGCILQIVLIAQLDYNEPVPELQTKLGQIKMHKLLYIRLGILSVPFYIPYIILGFYAIGFDIYTYGDRIWWISQLLFSAALLPVSIWFFNRISHKNIHIPWVKKFINHSAGKQITEAMTLIKEIEEFRDYSL